MEAQFKEGPLKSWTLICISLFKNVMATLKFQEDKQNMYFIIGFNQFRYGPLHYFSYLCYILKKLLLLPC